MDVTWIGCKMDVKWTGCKMGVKWTGCNSVGRHPLSSPPGGSGARRSILMRRPWARAAGGPRRRQVWALDRQDGNVTLETAPGACRDFLRGACRRPAAECKFAHRCAAHWHPGAPRPLGLGD